MFTVLRISLGDFDFGESTFLGQFDNLLFWVIWFIVVVMTCIVFLNFIIAEVSASYEKVNEKVKGLIEQERAQLINEAEDMMLESQKQNPMIFPKYLITREVTL